MNSLLRLGFASLAPLALGLVAFVPACSSSSSTSATGSCSDGVKNGAETDVDCGGGLCDKCAEDQACGADADCGTTSCKAGKCAIPPAPTCVDGVKNQQETDVDCAGECAPCGDGKICVSNNDCGSGLCTAGTCAPTGKPTCVDGKKNQDETDVDCGGGTCPKCGYAKACMTPSDCLDNVCTMNACAAPSCTDGTKNSNETDVDCGGPDCTACASGKKCSIASDCTSSMCSMNICG
jgi:hypothetical protein